MSAALQPAIAHITVSGAGDLDAGAAQVQRFLSLDIDARRWPDVARRDAVIEDAQERLPGLRPCGFHSPYEAAAWAVLAQRVRIVQAARLRHDLVGRHGDGGAFPTPRALQTAAPDVLARHGPRLASEITERYGPGATLDDVSEARRPFRSWATVHLRALRERRTSELGDRT